MKSMRILLSVVALLAVISCATPAAPADPTPDTSSANTPIPATVVPASKVPEQPSPAPTDGPPLAKATVSQETVGGSPTPLPADTAGKSGQSWSADGVISENEYAQSTAIGPVSIHWGNDGTFLYIAAEAETTGWIAVGLHPETRMQGANFLIGSVVDGKGEMWDAYGTAPVGATHPPDLDLGGSDDIVAHAVVEESGVTRFEAQIPLDSGDKYDRPLSPGQAVPIIAATGSGDDYNSRHAFRGAGEITLDPAQ